VTALEALLQARQHGARVWVEHGRLEVEADEPLPSAAVEQLRLHREALVTMLTIEESPSLVAEPPTEEQRFKFAVRWGRERGWLQVRDVFSGEWLEVLASECPPWWRDEAFKAKRRVNGDPRD
jgi:hypothetical protein